MNPVLKHILNMNARRRAFLIAVAALFLSGNGCSEEKLGIVAGGTKDGEIIDGSWDGMVCPGSINDSPPTMTIMTSDGSSSIASARIISDLDCCYWEDLSPYSRYSEIEIYWDMHGPGSCDDYRYCDIEVTDIYGRSTIVTVNYSCYDTGEETEICSGNEGCCLPSEIEPYPIDYCGLYPYVATISFTGSIDASIDASTDVRDAGVPDDAE